MYLNLLYVCTYVVSRALSFLSLSLLDSGIIGRQIFVHSAKVRRTSLLNDIPLRGAHRQMISGKLECVCVACFITQYC